LRDSSPDALVLSGSFLNNNLQVKLAEMAGSPDVGACWRGWWPVVRADRPRRALGVIAGLEKYSFNISDQVIGPFLHLVGSRW